MPAVITSYQVDFQSFMKHVNLTGHQVVTQVTHLIIEIPLVLRDSTEEKEGKNFRCISCKLKYSKMKKDVEKKQTTTSSSNLFTQSEESLQTSEELFNTTGCQKEFDIDQELVKRKEENAKLRNENSDLK